MRAQSYKIPVNIQNFDAHFKSSGGVFVAFVSEIFHFFLANVPRLLNINGTDGAAIASATTLDGCRRLAKIQRHCVIRTAARIEG